jgi:hypothetical protein
MFGALKRADIVGTGVQLSQVVVMDDAAVLGVAWRLT